MLNEFNTLVVGEALPCRLEHEPGEIKTYTEHVAAIKLEKGEQAPVARA